MYRIVAYLLPFYVNSNYQSELWKTVRDKYLPGCLLIKHVPSQKLLSLAIYKCFIRYTFGVAVVLNTNFISIYHSGTLLVCQLIKAILVKADPFLVCLFRKFGM